jgi:Raf kinase inhibitor-like YbhB/YbcL family protein
MKAFVFTAALAAASAVSLTAIAAEEFGIQPNMLRATYGLMGKEGMTLMSKDLKEGEAIPLDLSSYGASKSPQLSWTGVPKGTKSFAVALEDGDANRDGAPILHWLAYNVPGDLRSLPGGLTDKLPGSMAMGKNIQGKPAYMGPRPPAGVSHIYHYEILALDTVLPLKEGATRAEFAAAAKDHVLASTELDGWYSTPLAKK